MAIAVILILLVAGSVIVLPVLALTQVGRARREIQTLSDRLRELERARDSDRPLSLSAPPPIAPPVPVSPSPPVPSALSHEPTSLPAPPPSIPPMSVPVPKPASPSTASPFSWEMFMGAKLFAWIGGLALFLGVAYFVKYSFDNQLISREVRATLGFLTGLSLVIGGILTARFRRYTITAQVLCATGVVCLYAVTFAAHAVYGFAFFDAPRTFGLMSLITVAAFVLAVRLDARVVALLGILGGFLTPVLLATGQDHAWALFGYIAFLDLGLIALALHRRWDFLVPLGVAGTVILEIGWAAEHFRPEKLTVASTVVLGFAALFVAGLALMRRQRGCHEAGWLSAAFLPFTGFGFAAYALSFPPLGAALPVIFLVIVTADLLALAAGAIVARTALLSALAGAAAFPLMAAWIRLHLSPSQLGSALAACLCFAGLHTVVPAWIHRPRLPASALGSAQICLATFLSFLLLSAITIRLPLLTPNPVFAPALVLTLIAFELTRRRSLTWLPLASLAGVVVLLAAWQFERFTVAQARLTLLADLTFHIAFLIAPFLLRSPAARLPGLWIASALSGPAIFPLVAAAVRLTWPDSPRGLLAAAFAVPPLLALVAARRPVSVDSSSARPPLGWYGGVVVFFLALIFPLQFSGHWITLGWALLSLALLIGGLWKRNLFVRYAALILLSAALIKLFLHDLANLANLYRVAALVGVAIVAILASFIYQRFQLKEPRERGEDPRA